MSLLMGLQIALISVISTTESTVKCKSISWILMSLKMLIKILRRSELFNASRTRIRSLIAMN